MRRRRTLPGDDVLEHPSLVTTHAAVIDAEPEAIWPWLVQIAQRSVRRAAEGAGRGNPNQPTRTVGIVMFEPNRTLVLRSSSRFPRGRRRKAAHVDWVWAFVLEDLGNARTRVIYRMSCDASPWRAAAVGRLLAVPGETVRVRRLMAGLARRATAPAERQSRDLHFRDVAVDLDLSERPADDR